MIGRDTLAFRTLLEIAHLRPDIDEQRCRLILEFLDTAGSLQASLQRDLAGRHLTELRLSVLIVLFLLHPSPSTPADLAVHSGATRSAISDVLAQLTARGYLRRDRDTQDRRTVYIHLTRTGHQAAESGLLGYLGGIARCARYVQPRTIPRLLELCAQLNEGSGCPAFAQRTSPSNS